MAEASATGPTPLRQCGRCDFFGHSERAKNGTPTGQIVTVCRRYPPTVQMVEIGEETTAAGLGFVMRNVTSAPLCNWPEVTTLDWCGEFRERALPAA